MDKKSNHLVQMVERMAGVAAKFGLNISDDRVAQKLCDELATQLDDVNRTESKRDIVLAAVEAVAGQYQGQAMLDKIQRDFGREPTISELLKAGYARAQPTEEPVQPPGPDASATVLLDYYFKHIAKK